MFLPCSRSRFCFLETKLTLETMLLLVWQNWETLGRRARTTGVSGNMFPRFARPLENVKFSENTSTSMSLRVLFNVKRSVFEHVSLWLESCTCTQAEVEGGVLHS